MIMSDSKPARLSQFYDKTAAGMVAALFLAYVIVLILTAGLIDDAFIGFRVVDNLYNGFGLTWNAGERVQAYTAPLWVMVLSVVFFFTRELVYSTLIVSIILSAAAVYIVVYKISVTRGAKLFGLAALIMSKAFIDYSSSGLENPLTYLLLAVFLWVFLDFKDGRRKLFLLSLTASLAAVNRLDNLPLFLPPLLYQFLKNGEWRGNIPSFIAGLSPLIVWEGFAILYYGFPFPNTAYAKVIDTSIPILELMIRGVFYILDTLIFDPLTVLVIIGSIVIAYRLREPSALALAAGIMLQIMGVVAAGGDFMSGRFFAAPFLCAVVIICRYPWVRGWKVGFLMLSILGIGFMSYNPPPLWGLGYNDGKPVLAGIADERGAYYQGLGLVAGLKTDIPQHEFRRGGEELRRNNTRFTIQDTIGMRGYYAGPDVYILDLGALADPVIARLPQIFAHNWRAGHIVRDMPAGYNDTLISGRNMIKDPGLAKYYDKMRLITRGGIFGWERLKTIVGMNAGQYDYLIRRYNYSEYGCYLSPQLLNLNQTYRHENGLENLPCQPRQN